MAESIKDKIVYFLIANFVFLIISFAQQVRWQTQVDNRIQVLEVHSVNEQMHPPVEKRIELFVPRVELDGRLRSIEATLNEIKSDVKKNLK